LDIAVEHRPAYREEIHPGIDPRFAIQTKAAMESLLERNAFQDITRNITCKCYIDYLTNRVIIVIADAMITYILGGEGETAGTMKVHRVLVQFLPFLRSICIDMVRM